MAAYAAQGPCPDGGDTVALRKVSNCVVFENPLLSPVSPGLTEDETGLVFLNEAAVTAIPMDQQMTWQEGNLRVGATVERAHSMKVGPPKPPRSAGRSVRQCESLPQDLDVGMHDEVTLADAVPPNLPARNTVKASVSVPQHSPTTECPKSPKKPPRRPSPLLPALSSLVQTRPLPPPPDESLLPRHMEGERLGMDKRPSSMTALDKKTLSPDYNVDRTAVTPQPRFSAPSLPQEFRIHTRSESCSPVPRRVVRRRSRQRPRSSSMTALYTQPRKSLLVQDSVQAIRRQSAGDMLTMPKPCEDNPEDEEETLVPTLPRRTSASYILMTRGESSHLENEEDVSTTQPDGVYKYDQLKDERTYESIKDKSCPLYDKLSNSPPPVRDGTPAYISLGPPSDEPSESSA